MHAVLAPSTMPCCSSDATPFGARRVNAQTSWPPFRDTCAPSSNRLPAVTLASCNQPASCVYRCSESRARRLATPQGAAGTLAASGEFLATLQVYIHCVVRCVVFRIRVHCKPSWRSDLQMRRVERVSPRAHLLLLLCRHHPLLFLLALGSRADARTVYTCRSLAAPAPVAGARVAQRFGEPRWYR